MKPNKMKVVLFALFTLMLVGDAFVIATKELNCVELFTMAAVAFACVKGLLITIDPHVEI